MPTSTSAPTTPFPLYLLPSIPFRRRRSSATTVSSSSPTTSPSSSPPTPTSYLATNNSTLRCSKCLTDLIPTTSIISKGFTGRHGRAYLVSPPPLSALPSTFFNPSSHHKLGDLPNTHTHKAVPRQLVTGAHTVSDISCASCGMVLGWKYVEAEEESQRYKVGKFILETRRVVKGVDWEHEREREDDVGIANKKEKEEDAEIEFDSQDEDECEDLFMGIWSPGLAVRRRRNRVGFGRDEE